MVRKYADVFAVCDEDLGYTDIVKHEIPVTMICQSHKPTDGSLQISLRRLRSTFPDCLRKELFENVPAHMHHQ